MLILTNGIVTKTINIGENNKLITILTKETGVIYAFINKCRKIDNNMLAASEMLAYSQFVLFKNKEKYIVNEAQTLKLFPKIREDIEKLSLACYISELVNEIAGEGQFSEEYLRLILNSLYVLDEEKKSVSFIKSVVELKIMAISGFMPDLVCCKNCLEEPNSGQINFLMSGDLICSKCLALKPDMEGMEITSGVLAAMRYIIYSDISKIYSFKLADNDLLILSKLTQNYLLAQTDLRLPTLKYLLSVIDMKNT